MEAINIACSVVACYRWPLADGDVENAYFNAEQLTRILMLRLPKGGLLDKSISPDTHRLKAHVPIYGTRDAGRGFWNKLRRVLTDKAQVTENFTLKAFHYVNKDGHLAAMVGPIVYDTINAIRPDHKWILDAIAAQLVFGKIEESSSRFCGRVIVQEEDFSVKVTCRQTTLKIIDINISTARPTAPKGPVSKDELQQYMSAVVSLSLTHTLSLGWHECAERSYHTMSSSYIS